MPIDPELQREIEFNLQEIEMRMAFLDATISAITAETEAMVAKINELTERLQPNVE